MNGLSGRFGDPIVSLLEQIGHLEQRVDSLKAPSAKPKAAKTKATK